MNIRSWSVLCSVVMLYVFCVCIAKFTYSAEEWPPQRELWLLPTDQGENGIYVIAHGSGDNHGYDEKTMGWRKIDKNILDYSFDPPRAKRTLVYGVWDDGNNLNIVEYSDQLFDGLGQRLTTDGKYVLFEKRPEWDFTVYDITKKVIIYRFPFPDGLPTFYAEDSAGDVFILTFPQALRKVARGKPTTESLAIKK